MTAFSKRISAALLALACWSWTAHAAAVAVGSISLSLEQGHRIVNVGTAGLAKPSLQPLDKKLLIVIPGGQRAMKTLKVHSDPVVQIRFGKQGGDLRVVLDLSHEVKASLGAVSAKGFSVDLGPVGSAPPATAAKAEPDEALAPAASGYTYSIVDLALGGDEEHSELIISANGPASYKSMVRDKGRLLTLLFHNSSLAFTGDLGKLKDDAVESVQAHQVNSGGESQVKVDIQLVDKLDYALKRDQNQLLVRLDRPERKAAAPRKGDLESLVTIDVQNADLIGVLKTLCEQAGFEYQFSKELMAKTPPDSLVTAKVHERPLREVADTLLVPLTGRYLQQGNTLFFGLDSEVTEKRGRLPQIQRTYAPRYLSVQQCKDVLAANFKRAFEKYLGTDIASEDPRDHTRLLLVGTNDDVAAVLNALAKYDVPYSGEEAAGSDAGGGSVKTQVFRLQYLDPDKNGGLITGAITQLYQTGEDPPKIYIDVPTRTVVVTTALRYLKKIEKLLSRIDVRPNQVNIEARIVEVNETDGNLLGVDWSSVSTKQSGLIDSSKNSIPESQGLLSPSLSGTFASQLTYATIQNGLGIQARIQALVDTKKAELVSSPNITVRDNQSANISVTDVLTSVDTTTTITNGIATVASTSRSQSVPLSLDVLPKLSIQDRRVLMTIKFNLTTPTGPAPSASAEVPTTNQVANTEVSVNSGDTAVIGGLIRQSNISQERKVPVLGDIPLLGILFRSNQVTKEKKEVIIFITPSIVED